jgi:uncharacterized protein
MYNSVMTILIIHGILGRAGIHWQQWLHDQLEAQGHTVIMPTFSEAKRPDRQTWLREIRDRVDSVKPEELVLVGHSLGTASALDYLEQCSGKVHALVSVAGMAEDYGAELNGYFLREKHTDFAKVKLHLDKAIVVYGDDDPYVAPWALQQVADGLGVAPIIVENGGHLNAETGYTTFPRLLEAIKTIL